MIPLKTNMAIKHPPFEDVFSIEHVDLPMSCWFSGVYEIPIQELPRREGGSIVQSRRTPFWDSWSFFFSFEFEVGRKLTTKV